MPGRCSLSEPSEMDLPRTPSFRLHGQRALVTGAGRGIGLALAAALAQAGAEVTLAARSSEEIEAGASAIQLAGGIASAAVLDVTDLAAVQRFFCRAARVSHCRQQCRHKPPDGDAGGIGSRF